MNLPKSLATWDVLQDFGFEPDDHVFSDVMPGLSFDFGNFKLSASCVVNRRFVDIVMFGGVLSTPRTLVEVNFEMPRHVTSREQCAAWIVWNLDKFGSGSIFNPPREAPWLDEGRQNQGLLPWIARSREYEARPLCLVPRDWLRLALKTLVTDLASAEDELQMVFGFDGTMLKIHYADRALALPAEGKPWATRSVIPAKSLSRLPKRLMSDRVDVSIWDSQLRIGRWCYPGVAVHAE